MKILYNQDLDIHLYDKDITSLLGNKEISAKSKELKKISINLKVEDIPLILNIKQKNIEQLKFQFNKYPSMVEGY